MTPRYATPAAFHAAVETRLRAAAKASGRPVNELRRHYLTQRFLARVYAATNPKWVLLGGSALLARIPGARHSRDVDFAYPHTLATVAAELAKLVGTVPAPDPFAFDIEVMPARDEDHLSLKITARLGVTTIDTIPVDITRRPRFATLDIVRPDPVITVDDVDDLPAFLTIPLAHQVADKICAMYETHGAAALPSTRFRDLVDLVIIIDQRTGTELAANTVTAALTTEQTRRRITIPADLPAPGPQWVSGYNRLATPLLPRNLNRLDDALTLLHAFVAPILTATATGSWDPASRHWG
ncbi:nucleotidyl transferase AbiEii/AbiGii toxin family protein [Mycobacterium sp. CVI_P3]|uniref:Nucleotidyl transferase AbiEii/AbiGii toxin family protein n=1 Tax=Mycobacterium pinniadriaticum TaxID=2994102 RepID=A0ABT3SK95_9MYCO|nr:nucleotidyl transferase AbiEii/AbiGii toxin family protein [Mycobacterium pinniadriaticum]MCX2933370.1 nucleotidyl transferase AbiEii/AbiGii toxin family protein [Mycobacterium pinniadriaticum]MCX2939792.1 nucleotidyl transferase AbiEii/AbiGii toxin family protein [Mycobacterium pinniadriaticum]